MYEIVVVILSVYTESLDVFPGRLLLPFFLLALRFGDLIQARVFGTPPCDTLFDTLFASLFAVVIVVLQKRNLREEREKAHKKETNKPSEVIRRRRN